MADMVKKKRTLLETVQTLIHGFNEQEIDAMFSIILRATERLLTIEPDKDGNIIPSGKI
jgi:hypothetical protein